MDKARYLGMSGGLRQHAGCQHIGEEKFRLFAPGRGFGGAVPHRVTASH